MHFLLMLYSYLTHALNDTPVGPFAENNYITCPQGILSQMAACIRYYIHNTKNVYVSVQIPNPTVKMSKPSVQLK